MSLDSGTTCIPVIVDMKIADVRTRHIIDLFHRIRTYKERPVAQRTVHSISSVVSALFRDAKLTDKVEQSPCGVDERHLGRLVDKDPEWRAIAIFSRDEVETLISHPGIPYERRIVYALELLAGVRTGEAVAPLRPDEAAARRAARRVRLQHAQRAARRPRRRTPASTSPCTRPSLRCSRSGARRRTRTRTGEAFRGYDYSGERWRRDDLPTLGWRHRRHYDMRATFITLVLEDGPITTCSRSA